MKETVLQLNPYTLSFDRDHKFYETDFLSTYFQKNLRHLRFCHLAAIFFLCVGAYTDFSFYPESLGPFLMIKFFIIIPIFALGLWITFSKYYRRWYQIMLAGYVLLVGGGYNTMILITDNSNIMPLVLGIIFSFIFNYTFIRLRFIASVISGCILLIISSIILLFFKGDIPTNMQLSIVYIITMLNILGMVISYTAELAYRREFHLERALKEERDNQAALNNQLKASMEEIRVLKGILPICAECKKIRDDNGNWSQVESFIRSRTEAEFSHSLCPECAKDLYPELYSRDFK